MPSQYKHEFVKFILSIEWDWFITIPVGHCPPDDEVLWRLRRIEAELNKRYVATRHHKVPSESRFQIAVAFEGERNCGTRHAHVLQRDAYPVRWWWACFLLSSSSFGIRLVTRPLYGSQNRGCPLGSLLQRTCLCFGLVARTTRAASMQRRTFERQMCPGHASSL
jgi:hypothetical protein